MAGKGSNTRNLQQDVDEVVGVMQGSYYLIQEIYIK
jgi:hypothetical protein